MNEKLKEFAQKHSLTVNKKGCYGEMYGYQMGFYINRFANPKYVICISAHTAKASEQIISFLKKKKDELKLLNFDVLGVGIILYPALYFSVYNQVEKILKTVTDFLKNKGVGDANVCPYCNREMTEKILVSDGGHRFYVHEECFNLNYQLVKEDEKQESESPDNYLLAIIGAILGALIGCAALVGLFIFGNFEVVAPVISAVAAHFLYGFFGGKASVKKIVTVGVVSLILTFITYILCNIVKAVLAKPAQSALTGLISAFTGKGLITSIFLVVGVLIGVFYCAYTTIKSFRKPTSDLKKVE